MDDSFLVKTPSGLYCSAGDFYLDPKRPVSSALVSHAHGDHAVATAGTVYCTAPTVSFMKHRLKQKAGMRYVSVEFGDPFYCKAVKVTFVPAGHILGSAQILMEFGGMRYLYTGDFKIQPDDSCETFQFVACDHLITETTFASPEYTHPDPADEIERLMSENDKIILGAYSLGKAQRLTQLISRHAGESHVYVHDEPGAYHKLYEQHGYQLGAWRPYRRTDFERSKKAVYIVPPAYFRRTGGQNMLRVFATGWKKSFYRCDRVLPISDHADWPGVLELVRRTNAKKIYTVHGNGKFLKDHLKERIEVKIIG
jgi:putative mRNA 3-end processing factor